jgi:hypothetical protein
MPATLPTIVTPLPSDPRVMRLAKATALTRREAFGAAAEAWAWLAAHAVDGIVPATEPDTLDGIVDVPGIGQAMLAVGLVGTVNDGLVLPGELRQRQRDDAEPRGRHRGDDGDAPGDERRRAINAEASRRYRQRKKMTGSKAKSHATQPRSLGHVAGHEIRLFEGRFGPYAMVLRAAVGGVPFKKLTTGDKSWTFDDVTLADVLPGLVEKWRAVHDREQSVRDPAKRKILEPSFEALQAEAARHDDGNDASARHDDASALPSSSKGEPATGKRRSGKGLGVAGASSSRHDDAPSSMSSISSPPLSSQEEKREEEERKIRDRAGRLCGGIFGLVSCRHLEPKFFELCREAWDRWHVTEYVAGEPKKTPMPNAAAADLGIPVEEVMTMGVWDAWTRFRRQLLDQLEAEKDSILAGGSHEPGEAKPSAQTTTEAAEGDLPATGSVEAHERDDDQHDASDTLEAAAATDAVVTTTTADGIGDDADGQHVTLARVGTGA